jgi:hypothetical protein
VRTHAVKVSLPEYLLMCSGSSVTFPKRDWGHLTLWKGSRMGKRASDLEGRVQNLLLKWQVISIGISPWKMHQWTISP